MTAGGFRLVLTPELPEILRGGLPLLVDDFLGSRGLTRDDVLHVLAHPGGAKILEALPGALGLLPDRFRFSEAVLHDFGNVSSASALLVLERWMAPTERQIPGYRLLASFGPGFAAQMVLVRT